MKKYILIWALAAVAGVSCSKKLEIAPPSNVTDEQIKVLLTKNPDQVLAPMIADQENRWAVGQYNYASHTTWQCYNLAQCMKGNDMVHFNHEMFMNDYKLLDYREANGYFNAWYWEFLYRNVYLANQVLKLIEDGMLTDTPVGKKLKQYKAAGLTLRAFAYIYLMWIYTDDPLVGTSKLGLPIRVPVKGEVSLDPVDRSPSADCWNLVITDLTEAVRLFKESGMSYKAKNDDVDVMVANALLCRAAITTGQWDKVVGAANEIYSTLGGWKLMSEEEYVGAPDKLNGFLSQALNSEKILSWDYSKTYHSGVFNGTSFAGWMNIYGGGYGGQYGQAFQAIDSRLYNQMADGDYRKKNFLSKDISYTYMGTGTVVASPVTLRKYFNQKFGTALSVDGKPDGATGNYLQDEIIIRTSEILLLKAEAQFRGGDEPGARTTLSELTAARGAAAVTESGDALFKRIQLESRIELWGENGTEYYNNKRWGLGVNRTGSENHTEYPAVQPGVAFTWQIPVSETNYHPTMPQNP